MLHVANIIISLRWVLEAREKGTGMDPLVGGGMLGEDRPYSHTRCVHLYNELTLGFGDLEDGGGGEVGLEGVVMTFVHRQTNGKRPWVR